MKFEKNVKQITCDRNSSSIYNHRRVAAIHGYHRMIDEYPIKYNNRPSGPEKDQLLRELYQVKEDITKFKSELNGLAKQMDGMELHLNLSEHRVHEIEQDITATQEVNVNLQVILERAVHRQKETDVYAIRAMKNLHSNLATVVYETGQLRGRLACIANYQRQQQGNVVNVAERIRQYSQLLEEAIRSIQTRPKKRTLSLPELKPEPMVTVDSKRKKSFVNNNSSNSNNNNHDLYKHRIIRKRVSNLETSFQPWLPQKGLRILLSDSF